MSRTYDDLPRDWMVANIEMGRSAELKAFILQAVEWGFDQPEGLTNNGKRVRWLRECREKAWGMVCGGQPVPEPGKAQPADEKPARAPKRPSRPRPARLPLPEPEIERPSPSDVFLGRPRRGRRAPQPGMLKADLCVIPAREVNAFLRSLPQVVGSEK